jgi:hypothetical protein
MLKSDPSLSPLYIRLHPRLLSVIPDYYCLTLEVIYLPLRSILPRMRQPPPLSRFCGACRRPAAALPHLQKWQSRLQRRSPTLPPLSRPPRRIMRIRVGWRRRLLYRNGTWRLRGGRGRQRCEHSPRATPCSSLGQFSLLVCCSANGLALLLL